MSIASLTPRVREALGVSSSYDAATIPAAIKRAAQRLLRDYNFPKALTNSNIVLQFGVQDYPRPAGSGKILRVQYYNPTDDTYSEWLTRLDRAGLPINGGYSSHNWWTFGTRIFVSNKADQQAVSQGMVLNVHYLTIDPDVATWIYDDFEDVLFYMTVYREAAAMRKPEVQQAYQALYTEELQALAIYLNELEWDGVVVNQREERIRFTERYPA